MKNAMKAKGIEEQKIVAMMVNKRVGAKFFNCQGAQAQNVPGGCVVDSKVAKSGMWEFYLVSTKARQGVSTPTHFTILYDTIGCDPSDLHLLSYKLCYNYYNVSGPIKTVAPITYAHRLCNLIGERYTSEKDLPHVHLCETMQSLYFI
jgi:hypothetical protein